MLKLKKFLDQKGLTCRMCAAEIGISEKSMYNKISGATDFTYSEFCKLRRLFPAYNMDYLMCEEETAPEEGVTTQVSFMPPVQQSAAPLQMVCPSP